MWINGCRSLLVLFFKQFSMAFSITMPYNQIVLISIVIFCRLLDISLMVDPLSYFLFQPVLHNWCTKGCGMYYPVCGKVHIKELFVLIGKSIPCSGNSGFSFVTTE